MCLSNILTPRNNLRVFLQKPLVLNCFTAGFSILIIGREFVSFFKEGGWGCTCGAGILQKIKQKGLEYILIWQLVHDPKYRPKGACAFYRPYIQFDGIQYGNLAQFGPSSQLTILHYYSKIIIPLFSVSKSLLREQRRCLSPLQASYSQFEQNSVIATYSIQGASSYSSTSGLLV